MYCLFLPCIIFLVLIACDDEVTQSLDTLPSPDQGVSLDQDLNSNMEEDIAVPLEDQEMLIEVSDQMILDMDSPIDMPPMITDEGVNDMLPEDMQGLDQAFVDQGSVMDMEVMEIDMYIEISDMEIPTSGLGIRESCQGSDECAEGLSCLGWPTGSFCTPTCGYSSAPNQASNPDCPLGYALECHVSNQCLPAQCSNGCDPGYACDESNRCAPYE
ncbi:MAG: hypothetical protein CMH49_02110 [Myxococcales bacterium]|nr:hypothetical protein [Myxococcales bacterium]